MELLSEENHDYEMLVPNPWNGLIGDSDLEELKSLPSRTWCSLYRGWNDQTPLPIGYDLYLISYYVEALDIDWILSQCEIIDAPIILLSDCYYYNFPSPPNLHCYTVRSWHRQLRLIQDWFPTHTKKHITHKVSAVCNRITQSKLVVTTALIEQFGLDDSLIILNDWLDPKSVHFKHPTGSKTLDRLADRFWNDLYGIKIKQDDFTQDLNYQRRNSDPWGIIYQSAALHFTNESFHYSYMSCKHGKFCYPGPFLTEKTFKCLLGGTGFVAVGQFHTYRALKEIGFQFDYGFTTEFDLDTGNITRLEKIISLIQYLGDFSAEEIFEMTKNSSQHNQDHILSGQLDRICQTHNDRQINSILGRFGR